MRMTLGRKLTAGFSIILLLMIVTALLTYRKSHEIMGIQVEILDVRVPTIEVARRLQRDVARAQNKGRQLILAGNNAERSLAARKAFESGWSEIDKDIALMNEIAPRFVAPGESRSLGEGKGRPAKTPRRPRHFDQTR